uniref:hypothetical protein n=1 Tax=Pedobacter schmidteae TaxID=2201271 RepID=UPI000EAFBB35|nr:hypothetical protein [Pedobacter schmidteae]
MTIGEALRHLRQLYWCRNQDLILALNTNGASYQRIEKGQKELSLILAVRLCRFYDISLDNLIDLIDPAELERKELSAIKIAEKRKARR